MSQIVMREAQIKILKNECSRVIRNAKSSHIAEAVAAALGYKTYAALLAQAKSEGGIPFKESTSWAQRPLEGRMFWKRLSELSPEATTADKPQGTELLLDWDKILTRAAHTSPALWPNGIDKASIATLKAFCGEAFAQEHTGFWARIEHGDLMVRRYLHQMTAITALKMHPDIVHAQSTAFFQTSSFWKIADLGSDSKAVRLKSGFRDVIAKMIHEARNTWNLPHSSEEDIILEIGCDGIFARLPSEKSVAFDGVSLDLRLQFYRTPVPADGNLFPLSLPKPKPSQDVPSQKPWALTEAMQAWLDSPLPLVSRKKIAGLYFTEMPVMGRDVVNIVHTMRTATGVGVVSVNLIEKGNPDQPRDGRVIASGVGSLRWAEQMANAQFGCWLETGHEVTTSMRYVSTDVTTDLESDECDNNDSFTP